MKNAVVVLAHGSRKKEAVENLAQITKALGRSTGITTKLACMQLSEPSFFKIIDDLANEGCTNILVIPLFLTNGTHMQEDIPELIENVKQRHTNLIIQTTNCLWPDSLIVDLLERRVRDIFNNHFVKDSSAEFTLEPFDYTQDKLREGPQNDIFFPHDIERESFDIIGNLISQKEFNDKEFEVVKRLVHTSGDPLIACMVTFSGQAVTKGIEALTNGQPVITDVNMVAAGINKNLASSLSVEVHTWIANEDVREEAEQTGKTRAMVSIEKLALKYPRAVIAIGNAPTALMQVSDLISKRSIDPPLVIAMPVGFVGTLQSKEAIKKTGVDFICVEDTRGGSNFAAATVNALLKLAVNEVKNNKGVEVIETKV